MDRVMKIVSWIISLVCVLGVALCGDAIMNHVMMTSFVGDGWFDKIVRVLIVIGRITLGWFVCYKTLFPIIYKYFSGDDTK